MSGVCIILAHVYNLNTINRLSWTVFEASKSYLVSSRLVWDTEHKPALKKNSY